MKKASVRLTQSALSTWRARNPQESTTVQLNVSRSQFYLAASASYSFQVVYRMSCPANVGAARRYAVSVGLLLWDSAPDESGWVSEIGKLKSPILEGSRPPTKTVCDAIAVEAVVGLSVSSVCALCLKEPDAPRKRRTGVVVMTWEWFCLSESLPRAA